MYVGFSLLNISLGSSSRRLAVAGVFLKILLVLFDDANSDEAPALPILGNKKLKSGQVIILHRMFEN